MENSFVKWGFGQKPKKIICWVTKEAKTICQEVRFQYKFHTEQRQLLDMFMLIQRKLVEFICNDMFPGLTPMYGTKLGFKTSFCFQFSKYRWLSKHLTHWGRVTHICVSKLTIIGSDNGLSPGRRQAIIWTNAGILLIGPLGTNFSEILIGIKTFSFTKMHLKMSSAIWCPFCLGLNVLMTYLCRYLSMDWVVTGLDNGLTHPPWTKWRPFCRRHFQIHIREWKALHWRHNDHDGVSNHQPHGCLLNRLFRHRSKKTSKLRVTGLCVGNSPRPVNSPHKRTVMRKMFPFDDVIMVLHFD